MRLGHQTRFQLEPIAAASLGQVHLARIKGERVVVKVQRPFLKEIFDVDLRNIRVLAQILQVLLLLAEHLCVVVLRSLSGGQLW